MGTDSLEPSALSNWLNAVPPGRIFYVVLGFIWLSYLWESYLSWRQHRVMQLTPDMPAAVRPVMDAETFAKSRAYGIDRSRFGLVRELWSQLLFTCVLAAQLMPWLWDVAGRHVALAGIVGELPQSLAFLAYTMLFGTVTDMPWSAYKHFVVEARHGFNKQTPGFFIKDQVKGLALNLIIGLPVAAALLWLIGWGGQYFYVYAWMLASCIAFVMMCVYPTFIAPLFDRYEPMREGRLKQRIEELASSLDFPLTKLLVVEGSKRSAHSNAYMYGLWRSKRIVLFDTLIQGYQTMAGGSTKPKAADDDKKAEGAAEAEAEEEHKATPDSDADAKAKAKGCNEEEILAVLGHELGHWSLGHNVSNIVISEVNMLLLFFAFGQLVNCHAVFAAFGFHPPAPLLLRLAFVMQFLLAPYHEILGFAMTCLTRQFEFQADRFAVRLGYGPQLRTALVKLETDNLGFPVYDWLFSTFNHSHPPLLHRLAAVEQADKDEQQRERKKTK